LKFKACAPYTLILIAMAEYLQMSSISKSKEKKAAKVKPKKRGPCVKIRPDKQAFLTSLLPEYKALQQDRQPGYQSLLRAGEFYNRATNAYARCWRLTLLSKEWEEEMDKQADRNNDWAQETAENGMPLHAG
jgi:hypothetical protein